MTKYLVSDKSGDHLPYTDESGSPDHRLMGAAWAALHEGYRGNTYDGPSKAAAIAKLTGIYKSEKMDTPQESAGNFALIAFNESYDATSGQLTITVIKPGFNKSKSRYYPAEMLKRNANIFEGAKMFADHQTEAEQRSRPEGSVRDWVGSLKKVWAEADGTVKASAVVIDPQFKSKLEELAKQNMLSDMGVSIRAGGISERKEIEGTMTNYVESLKYARSVDFVTFAGAGGQVNMIESDTAIIDESIDYVITRKGETVMTAEEIKVLTDKLAAAEAANATLTTQIAESAKSARIATAKAEVEKQLTESKLPDAAKTRIRKQFEAQESVETLPTVIKEEQEYIKTLTGGKVTNNGERQNGGQMNESAKPDFTLLGLSKEEAVIAAAGR